MLDLEVLVTCGILGVGIRVSVASMWRKVLDVRIVAAGNTTPVW